MTPEIDGGSTFDFEGSQLPARPLDSQEMPRLGEEVALGIRKGQKIGPYTVTGYIDRGAFAVVLSAVDPEGKKMAIKVADYAGGGRYIPKSLEVGDKDPELLATNITPAEAIFFRQEGAKINFLDNHEIDRLIEAEHGVLRNIQEQTSTSIFVKVDPKLYEVYGRPVIVMEQLTGQTLREKIDKLEGIRLNWFLRIAQELIKLEENPVITHHGDLKPENIIISRGYSVRLIDPSPIKHSDQYAVLTPHYNPLLLRDPKADIFGIGIMLYEILTGTLPFNDVPWQYAGREEFGEREQFSLSYFLTHPKPQDFNPNSPEELTEIVKNCLLNADYGLKELIPDIVNFLRKP